MAKNLEPQSSGRGQTPPSIPTRRVPLVVVGLLVAVLLAGLLLAGLGGLGAQQKQVGYDAMQGVPAPRTVISEGLSPPVGTGGPFGIPPMPTLPANWPAPLVQTHNGYTIAVQPLAADANQVVLSYTVKIDPALTGTPDAVMVATLHDSSGATLLLLNQPWTARPGYPQQLQFDGGGRTDLPANWAVQLTITLEKPPIFTPQLPPPPPTGVILGAPPFTPLPTQPRVVPPTSTAAPDPHYPTVGPPFQFALTVPVDRRVRAGLGPASATVNGVMVTLERVTVTDSQARIVLRPSVPGEAPASVDLLNLRLDWDQKSSSLPFGAGSPHLAPDGTFIWFQPGALLQQQGVWILTVQDATVMHNKPGVPGDVVTGPWTLRFALPSFASSSPVPPTSTP
ncbi:MAG: hypothetical protein M3Z04_09415 [Chloroflexota bacterium]|nr:hypothetical protein [Chloroflexota bacterium]